MKLLKKVNVIIIGLAVLLALGCDQNKDRQPGPQDPTGQVGQSSVLEEVTSSDPVNGSLTRNYTYNNTGQLIAINRQRFAGQTDPPYLETEAIVYNPSGLVESRKTYSSRHHPDTVYIRKVFEYNADSLVQKITTTMKDLQGKGTFASVFEYAPGGQLTKMSQVSPGNPVPYAYFLFSYPGPNQLKEEYYMLLHGSYHLAYTIETEFDAQKCPNPLDRHEYFNAVLHSDISLPDHNVIMQTCSGVNGANPFVHSYTYQYNQQGYPTACDVKETQKHFGFGYQ